MIHADSHHKRVVEIPLDARWQRRVIGVWRVAMSGSTIGGVVGGAIGWFVGGPVRNGAG